MMALLALIATAAFAQRVGDTYQLGGLQRPLFFRNAMAAEGYTTIDEVVFAEESDMNLLGRAHSRVLLY